jgi:HD superfamily phosphohydrolase YqeK
MDKQKIINESEKFMRDNIPKSRDKEDYFRHIAGARKYSIKLSEFYHADKFICEVAAILHDVGADVGEKHAEESAIISVGFLSQYSIPEDILNKIIKCIKNHSMGSTVGSIEEQILQDADGIIFIEDTYKNFFEKRKKIATLDVAKKYAIDKLNGMMLKIKTDEGNKIASKLLPISFNYIKNQK